MTENKTFKPNSTETSGKHTLFFPKGRQLAPSDVNHLKKIIGKGPYQRDLLIEYQDSKNRGSFKNGIVHSFVGTKEELEKAIELDLFIGVNGCSVKTEENLEVVKEIPLEKMLLESGLILMYS